MQSPNLVLASTSQTRRAILENAGLNFETRQPLSDEEGAKSKLINLSAKELARYLAAQKALSLSTSDSIILGCDQTLSCRGKLYNKPRSIAEALQQLLELRGQSHMLHSALAIAQNGKVIWTVCDEAKLTMRNFSDEFAKAYTENCGPKLLNTVGSYQLENTGSQLFEKIEGDYFTILGLPLLPCLAFLRHIKFIAT